jgi:hypothetical protein
MQASLFTDWYLFCLKRSFPVDVVHVVLLLWRPCRHHGMWTMHDHVASKKHLCTRARTRVVHISIGILTRLLQEQKTTLQVTMAVRSGVKWTV